jgi:formylglycine-generating enzyme
MRLLIWVGKTGSVGNGACYLGADSLLSHTLLMQSRSGHSQIITRTRRFFAVVWMFAAVAQGTVVIDYVTVGNAGNADDKNYGAGVFGSVAASFKISKYEVTNAQYTEFLNVVDPTGLNVYALYNQSMQNDFEGGIVFFNNLDPGQKFYAKPGYENMPVVYVDLTDAMRFSNWLQNGQTSGGTETGAYRLADGVSALRKPGAQVWIPSENEWYKAAYYQPKVAGGDNDSYWLYPTKTNTAPLSTTPNGTNSNSANYNYAISGSIHATAVGTYSLAKSYYGTFDQGGNVGEWTDSIGGTGRVLRGGSWGDMVTALQADTRLADWDIGQGSSDLGFRVASIPEPAIGSLLMLGMLGAAVRRSRTARIDR